MFSWGRVNCNILPTYQEVIEDRDAKLQRLTPGFLSCFLLVRGLGVQELQSRIYVLQFEGLGITG